MIGLFLVTGSVGIVLIALPGIVVAVALYWALIRGFTNAPGGSDGADPYLSMVFGGARGSEADLAASVGDAPPAQSTPDRTRRPKQPGPPSPDA